MAMRHNPHIWVRRSTPLLAAATLALFPLAACSDSSDNGGGDKNAPEVAANPTSQQFTQGDALQVTLTATDDKTADPAIYYTLDGTLPTDQSTAYMAPIDIAEAGPGTILRFIAIDDAGNVSEVGLEGYTYIDPALGNFAQQWADSGHGDITAEAFRHWDEDGEVSTSCGKCHAADVALQEGFVDYALDGSVDNPSALPVGHYCNACHEGGGVLYDDLVTYPALEPVEFPSMETASLWSTSNMCVVCHSGRASTVDVNDKIAGAPGGPHTFTNIHYYAAAATLFGTETKGGYEYDGMDYAGRNTFGSHEATEQTCVGCHMQEAGGVANHSLEVDLARCNACHAGASFPELAGSPAANYDAITATSGELLTLIEDYAANTIGEPITYDPAAYPYWFKDNGDRYDVFDDALLKAAYNYQVVQKDPNGYLHNGTYTRQLVHDSIVDLGGVPSIAAPGRDGFTPSAGEAGKTEQWRLSGHADSDAEAFRHWDEDGAVSASCAQCHSSPGFVEYAQTGDVAADVALGSLVDCQACHLNADLYTDPSVRYGDAGHPFLDPVDFPSGAQQTLGDASNMCMTCHQGRESGLSVTNAMANDVVQEDPANPGVDLYDSFDFINRHYYAAAAILFGADVTAAYEYVGTGGYNTQNTFAAHPGALNTCLGCHGRSDADHTWEVQINDCAGCHQGITTFEDLGLPFGAPDDDYDGDGVGESFQLEIDGMKELLYAAIQDYANAGLGGTTYTSAIVYSSSAYPYWFVDTNGDGLPQEDETVYSNRYRDFDFDLLGAAFNYHSAQDPCNDIHNFGYALQTLYDSLDLLDDGTLNGSPQGSAAACVRP
jgi:hypothetical protein